MATLRPLSVLLIALLLGVSAAGEASPDPRRQRLWDSNWRHVAQKYVRVGDTFFLVSQYNPKYENSRQKSAEQLKKKIVLEWRRSRVIGITGTQRMEIFTPQTDLTCAAMALPSIEEGQYGWVHGLRLKDPEDQIVTLEVIDRGRLRKDRDEAEDDAQALLASQPGIPNYKDTELVDFGFQYRDAVARWNGARMKAYGFTLAQQVVNGPYIVAICRQGEDLVLVNGELLGKMTESDFLDLLRQRGRTQQEFIEQVAQLTRVERGAIDLRAGMLLWLERRLPPDETASR